MRVDKVPAAEERSFFAHEHDYRLTLTRFELQDFVDGLSSLMSECAVDAPCPRCHRLDEMLTTLSKEMP